MVKLPGIVLLAAFAGMAGPAAASRYPVDPAPRLLPDPGLAVAGRYAIDIHHASVMVKLSHMGLSSYTLRFNGITGGYDYNPADPVASKIGIVIDPASIDTGDAAFNSLIARDYFEAAKFPAITFTSTKIVADGHQGSVIGILDMHGVKKPVTLNVTYHGAANDEKPERMGFSASTTILRSDFGVDPYVPAEGDAATIQIEAEFRKI